MNLFMQGAYMQMNYRCLSRLKGLSERNWCRKQVLEGRIHLLGTDMHRLDYRPPELAKSLEWLKKREGGAGGEIDDGKSFRNSGRR